MKKNITMSLAALALLLTCLFVSAACSSNSGMEGSHTMGSARMGNQKMPGKVPAQ
jgi:hypothetical protein